MDSARWINLPRLILGEKTLENPLCISICFNPKRASCMCFPVNRLREPYTSLHSWPLGTSPWSNFYWKSGEASSSTTWSAMTWRLRHGGYPQILQSISRNPHPHWRPNMSWFFLPQALSKHSNDCGKNPGMKRRGRGPVRHKSSWSLTS